MTDVANVTLKLSYKNISFTVRLVLRIASTVFHMFLENGQKIVNALYHVPPYNVDMICLSLPSI